MSGYSTPRRTEKQMNQYSAPEDLSKQFTREVLQASSDAELRTLVRQAGQRWAHELHANSDIELLVAVNHTATITLGGLADVIRGMRQVSPLADEFAQRLVDLGPGAVDEAIAAILNKEGNQ